MEKYCWSDVLMGEEKKGLINERLPLVTPVTDWGSDLVTWAFIPFGDKLICYAAHGDHLRIRAIYRRFDRLHTHRVNLCAISWFWPVARAYVVSREWLWRQTFLRFARFRFWLHRRFGLRNPETMDWKQLLLCWRSTLKGAP